MLHATFAFPFAVMVILVTVISFDMSKIIRPEITSPQKKVVLPFGASKSIVNDLNVSPNIFVMVAL